MDPTCSVRLKDKFYKPSSINKFDQKLQKKKKKKKKKKIPFTQVCVEGLSLMCDEVLINA